MAAINTGDALLAEETVGAIAGEFWVPRYQRGYRWGPDEVSRLLRDIDRSQDRRYHLQPIVVLPRPDGSWELVDGQQRLTTLYLILQYIKHKTLPSAELRYSLDYETRPELREYLENPDRGDPEQNIDFSHVAAAADCIHDWFEKHPSGRTEAALDIFRALSKSVYVIRYQPADVDPIELFTRLNVGRIRLTDAELVKALVLARSHGAEGITDRAQEIAAQWDVIERDLRSPEVWAFVTSDPRERATHIELLLDTIADQLVPPPKGRRPLFHTFETLRPHIDASPERFWERLVRLHSLVLGWYDERDLFHKIGFLVATGDSFARIVDLSAKQAKSGFHSSLIARISERLGVTPARVRALDYEHDGAKCEQILLLMNLETVVRMKNSSERYSFRAHAERTWSLEHIHAQNAEEFTEDKDRAEWLRLHRKALQALPSTTEDQRADLVARIGELIDKPDPAVSRDKFTTLQAEIRAHFTSPADQTATALHPIANLALLSRADNSALRNSVFAVKRRQILKRDKDGEFIPPCTRRVFLKYYTATEHQQIHFWSTQDREAYLIEMLELLDPYLIHEEVPS